MKPVRYTARGRIVLGVRRSGGAADTGRGGEMPAVDPACGRFAEDVCKAYLQMATTGIPDETTLAGRPTASRVVFGPHETNLGVGRSFSDRHVAYYAARAAGGC